MTTATEAAKTIQAALEAGPTEGEWQSHETRVYFGREGGLDLRHAPRPEACALFIAAANPEALRALLTERTQLIERDAQSAIAVSIAQGETAMWRVKAEAESIRLDHIEQHARSEPKMCGNHVWWPTSFNSALKGPTLRAAIDAAIAAQQEKQG